MLTKVQNISTMQSIVKDAATIQVDIHQLNSRLISIKELFRNLCNLPAAAAQVQIPQATISQAIPPPRPVPSNGSTPQSQLRQTFTTLHVPQLSRVQSTNPISYPINTFYSTYPPFTQTIQHKTSTPTVLPSSIVIPPQQLSLPQTVNQRA